MAVLSRFYRFAAIIHCVFSMSILILVGKVHGFCGKTAKNLALEQRKIVLKALAYKGDCVTHYLTMEPSWLSTLKLPCACAIIGQNERGECALDDLTILPRRILKNGGYTCVIAKGTHFYTSQQRGVRPLVAFLHSALDFSDAVAADRVVGRATAFLYVLLRVRAVYAYVLSQGALEVLLSHGIEVAYEALVPNIINRRKDGICPFEEAVSQIVSADEALLTIEQKLSALAVSY